MSARQFKTIFNYIISMIYMWMNGRREEIAMFLTLKVEEFAALFLKMVRVLALGFFNPQITPMK